MKITTWGSVGLFAAVFQMLGPSAMATPPNTALLDGRPVEYDNNDFRGNDTTNPGFGAANVITNLYVTWDSEFLYIAVQGFVEGNKINVMLDVDPGAGTGATTTTNWTGNAAGYIGFNDPGWIVASNGTPFGLDYAFHSTPSGFNTIVRVLYDGEVVPLGGNNVIAVFDTQNGSAATGGSADIVYLNAPGFCRLKGQEMKMAWTNVYNSSRFGTVQSGELVPRGAALRIWAGIHNDSNADAFSAANTIPEQTSPNASYTNGILVTDSYIDIPVDANNDGLPDVQAGDVNAPYIKSVAGAQGLTNLFVVFNEDVNSASAQVPGNYTVAGVLATSASMLASNTVQLGLASALPAEGSFVPVSSTGVQDLFGNARDTEGCLTTAGGAIPSPVTVTFVLEANSGFGPSASNFFVTGAAFPLEEGSPPAMNVPMTKTLGTSLWTAVVNFPAGTPSNLQYRFAGTIAGTNNYEVIRLANYEGARRVLVLPTNGAPVAVTGYLGAAGAPLRTGGPGGAGFAALYNDPARGDSGVRQRTTVLFQLDLSVRQAPSNGIVVLQGSDPLRGFNNNGTFSDFAAQPNVLWDEGGIRMVDNGTLGDLVAGDGIYSRRWSFTTNGVDPLIVTDPPNSLAGGGFLTPPYFGSWVDQRSPRSIIYRYYVKDLSNPDPNVYLASPSEDLSYYLPDQGTNIVLPPFRWDNPALPLSAKLNPAEIVSLSVSGTTATVVYTNIPAAADNVVELAETPKSPWVGYGLAGSGASGVFTARVTGISSSSQVYRVVTPGYPRDIVWWTPASIPKTGGTVRVFYNQSKRALDGRPQIIWNGNNPIATPTQQLPMTFAGQGRWYLDLLIASNADTYVEFEFTEPTLTVFDKNGGTSGPKYRAQIGGRATWAPDPVAPGGNLVIAYDATGGILAGLSPVHVWLDFDGWEGTGWNGANNAAAMSNVGSNLWEVTIPVPSTATKSVNWVFKTGATPTATGGTVQWDNNNTRDWNAFIRQP